MPQAKINEAFYDESVYKVLGKVSIVNISNTKFGCEYFKYLPAYKVPGMQSISLSKDTLFNSF